MKEENKERFTNALAKHIENNTPIKGGWCKNEGCSGYVVKQVSSLFRGRYSFHLPACNKCGRIYTNAQNVPEVGIEAFEQMIQRPFTV